MLNVKRVLTKLAEIPNNLFIVKNYTASKTITGSWGYISGSEFGVSTPTGYTPVTFVSFSQDNPGCTIRGLSADAVGASGVMWLNNNGNSNTVNANIKILYVKTTLL